MPRAGGGSCGACAPRSRWTLRAPCRPCQAAKAAPSRRRQLRAAAAAAAPSSFRFSSPPLQRSAMEWEAPRLPRSPPGPSQLPALGELSGRYQLWGSTELFVRRSGRVFGSGLLPPPSLAFEFPSGLARFFFRTRQRVREDSWEQAKRIQRCAVTLIPRRRQPPELRFPLWESFLTLSAFRLHRILNQ